MIIQKRTMTDQEKDAYYVFGRVFAEAVSKCPSKALEVSFIGQPDIDNFIAGFSSYFGMGLNAGLAMRLIPFLNALEGSLRQSLRQAGIDGPKEIKSIV